MANEVTADGDTPDDEQFRTYFNQLLNPADATRLVLEDFHTNVQIPLLDDPITTEEVTEQIKQLKPNKACGPDGIAPGALKLFTPAWIVLLAALFNNIFSSGVYPQGWTTANLFTIHKKGLRSIPSNYRGISVINALAKVYDMVLCARLTQWFTPLREQAGAQAGRGCLEHIATLRMIIDLAWRKKRKLYVTFVDYEAAYDNVPRHTLFHHLRQLGCGATMLAALVATYASTSSVIGSVLVAATVGLRQGSPSSCWLFICFLNKMVKLFKDSCIADGFLQWLHLLVLMDDTVIFSTTREGMLRKIELLNEFCNGNNMKINLSKTKFMLINGTEGEKTPLVVGNLVIKWCRQYKYLGCMFTTDGKTSSAVAADAVARTCQAMKFISFVDKNNDAPFYVKKRVFDACVMSSLLYGCETWMNADLRPIRRLYNMCIRALLQVRNTTSTDICLIELGLPELSALVAQRQKVFFQRMSASREHIDDDPLIFAIHLCIASRTPTARHLNRLLESRNDEVRESKIRIQTRVANSIETNTRNAWYLRANPELAVHQIYTARTHPVNEIHRVSWTRLRLSAHSLAIEEGRWNRRGWGRLPVEERLCQCGAV